MKTAILVSAPFDSSLPDQVAEGVLPKPDFFALAEGLNATLLAPWSKRHLPPKPLRFARAAWAAFRERDRYDVIVSDLERVGILLALLLKLGRAPTRHIMICHGKVIRPSDLRLMRAFKLHTHIHRFVCYGPLVAGRLQSALALPPRQVASLFHAVDHRFWQPAPVKAERLIVSAGMLRRDYPTLIEAMRGLDLPLTIAAFSPWVESDRNGFEGTSLPPNVTVTRCDYAEMRALYGRALLVAVPLKHSQAQSGSLVMYEAMAMGKAVVATATQGQERLGILEPGRTGHYVAPGDVQGWREAIQRLCNHPDEALAMGKRARTVVEQRLNLDCYVQEFAAVVQSLGVEPAEVGKLFQRQSTL